MSSPEVAPNQVLAADAASVLAQAEQILTDGRIDQVPDLAVQQLLLAAVRLFSAKRDAGNRMEAFSATSVTATDVAVTAVAMTEVVNLELFELALWNGWSNI